MSTHRFCLHGSVATALLMTAAGLVVSCSDADDESPATPLLGQGAGNVGNPGYPITAEGSGTAGNTGYVGAGSIGNVPATGGTANVGNATTGGAANVGNATGGAANVGAECTNVRPTGTGWDEATCSEWATQTGECSAAWMRDNDLCNRSCGRCGGSSTNTGGSAGTDNTGGTSNSNATYPRLPSGAASSHATRYWDCCKPHCAWSNHTSNPVNSCGATGAGPYQGDTDSACTGGSATTCHSWAPWAINDQLSYGFVAAHIGDAQCGTCYQLDFTDSAIAGKTMIVMVTNTGAIQTGAAFDMLIPGGGVGDFYGCAQAWGISDGNHPDLGERYGGVLGSCGWEGNPTSCVANRCQQLFGNRGLTQMYEGCMWHAEWLRAENNPNFRYAKVDCPAELMSIAH